MIEVHAVSTWFDRKTGVTLVEDDVQNIVRQIKEIDQRLHVFYNPQSSGFDIVEHCLDGNQRLVFSCVELDNRVLHRLRAADHWGADTPDRGYLRPDGEDFLADSDRIQAEVHKQQDEELEAKMVEFADRYMWAMDSVRDRSSVGGQIHVKRDIRE